MRTTFAVALLLAGVLALGQTPSTMTSGILRESTPNRLTIETADHRMVRYQVSKDQFVGEPPLRLGEHLTVSSITDERDRYVATWVERVRSVPTPAERVVTVSSPSREDAAIAAARSATEHFVADLPNFQVRRSTTRVAREGRGRWRNLDFVTSTVAYRNGAETYSDIRIGDSEFSQPLDEINGLRSSGEFGQLVLGILRRDVRASFGSPRRVELGGRKSDRYPFTITREFSTWKISAPSEWYFTAYSGTLWIDAETSRILRVEMEAEGLPDAFPFDSVEMNVDYEFVKLEAGERFLLPTKSEIHNCLRGTKMCLRNYSVFTDYIKFDADSRIVFEPVK